MFCFVIFISILPSTIYGKNKNGSRDEEKPMYQGVFTAPLPSTVAYRQRSVIMWIHQVPSNVFVCVCLINATAKKENPDHRKTRVLHQKLT